MSGFMRMKGLATTIGWGTTKAANTGGALVNMRYTDTIAAPVATSTSAATSLLAGVAGAGWALSATLTTTGLVYANPDVPRNVTVWASGACTSAITVTGTDQFGNIISEAITANGSAIVAGTLVFKTLTALSGATDASTRTISIGQGSILGTSRKMNGLEIDGAVYTTGSGAATAVQETTRPVKGATADVHGVTFATALDPLKTYVVSYGSSEVR